MASLKYSLLIRKLRTEILNKFLTNSFLAKAFDSSGFNIYIYTYR